MSSGSEKATEKKLKVEVKHEGDQERRGMRWTDRTWKKEGEKFNGRA